MKKIPFVTDSQIYRPDQIADVLRLAVNDKNLRGNNKKIYYYDVACAFDIETTSFYRRGNVQYSYADTLEITRKAPETKFEKCAIMYVWQLGINGVIVMGRTWKEFLSVCESICGLLGLNENRRLIIYVHNLAYEFQFLRTLFTWTKVFAIDERKPIYAITSKYIEFRCSYLLTGYSLAKLGEHLQKYKVQKLVGDLDYSKIRHSQTPLTDKEIGYCVNDIKVVMSAITEKIENEGGITNIPLTKTGYVRKHCRKNCLYIKSKKTGKRCPNFRYNDIMKDLYINGVPEFKMLHRAFAGGFTHANSAHTGQIITDVASYDFTSSYPYVMVSEKFPMSHGVKVTITSKQEFEFLITHYCCIFNIRFYNIILALPYDSPISVSKCYDTKDIVDNNGRVFSAREILMTITNIDYKIYQTFYKWDKATVYDMWVYRKDYLPTEFIKTVLELYSNKTTLKGVRGKEVEYLASKEMVNACYGMAVTNPLRDEFVYKSGAWDIKEMTIQEMSEALYKYNIARNRFLFYPWGVFVTAYARRNLFTAIYALQNDYIYSDTDSVKVMNYKEHESYFKWYNMTVEKKLLESAHYHRLPFELFEPSTIKGIKKRLGVWDFEGVYNKFITLGAKRYMVKQKDVLQAGGKSYDYSLTVAGLDKKKAIPYLFNKYGDQIMEHFNDNLYIPTAGTGKNIHTYIDYPVSGRLIDYTGKECAYSEQSGVHLEPTDYTLNLSIQYLDYLLGKHLMR